MSMSADEEAPQYSRSIIMRVREQVHAARDLYNAEVSNGEVSEATRRQLARVVLTYHGALREFRDHSSVKGRWQDENSTVSTISRLRSQTATISEDLPGNTRATKDRTVPAIQTVSAAQLVEMTHELDDVANELGFAEQPRENTPIAVDAPQVLPDHIKESAPAFREYEQEARTDGGDEA